MDVHEYDCLNFVVRRDYSSPAARALRQPRRAPRLLASGRSDFTSTTPRVRVPRQVTQLVAPLVVDYSGLVVNYFTSAARPGASARRAARRADSSSTTPRRAVSSSTTEDHVWFEDRWMVASLCDE
jgi:hypothetical protein